MKKTRDRDRSTKSGEIVQSERNLATGHGRVTKEGELIIHDMPRLDPNSKIAKDFRQIILDGLVEKIVPEHRRKRKRVVTK